MPIATENGRRITGIVRGNFILNERSETASVADRDHLAYPVLDPNSAENVMTVRDDPVAKGQIIPRSKWRFVDGGTVALDGGFEPGRIYDVVYRTRRSARARLRARGHARPDQLLQVRHVAREPVARPRVTRSAGASSQSGRFLRHFLYQGFNQDEQGRRVFDGVFDQVGGAGRGSFNHRFGQASRDALQHFNILFPVDLFPFTDSAETDPETGATDSLLGGAARSGTAPKIFHLLTNSEYFNRAGSLVHTDPTGSQRRGSARTNTRIYMIASAPHGAQAAFRAASNRGGGDGRRAQR